MFTALIFMLAAPPTLDPEAERLRIAVAVAIEIAKAKEKKPAPKVAAPPSTFRYYQDARGQWWQVETAPEVGKTANPFPPSPTTPDAAGVVAPPPATAARPFVSLGAGRGALRVAPYSGSDGCTSFG